MFANAYYVAARPEITISIAISLNTNFQYPIGQTLSRKAPEIMFHLLGYYPGGLIR